MSLIPPGMPTTQREAFAHIAAADPPGIDEFKMMALLEAVSKGGYLKMAQAVSDPEARKLLEANGAEELAHGHRVRKVIKLLTGEDFPLPHQTDNPYDEPGPLAEVSVAALLKLAAGEEGGEKLYERWAAGIDNPEAAELLRQNGREELGHAGRLRRVAEILQAG